MKVNIPHIFTRDFPYLEKVTFFRKVLYAFMLFTAITMLPIAQDLYGYYGLVGTRGFDLSVPIYEQGTYALINVLNHPANSIYTWVFLVFVIGQLFFLITGLLNIWPRLSGVMVFFFTINLVLKGYIAMTGGEMLSCFLLFYLMFIHKPKSQGFFGELQNILNNAFYWILLIQVCILYFYSGFYKLYDEHWLDGHAIQYVVMIDEYGSWLTIPFERSYILSAIATYLTLAYQLLFPVLVWVKKVKVPYLIFGTLFHLLIAFGMGIFTFGIIMIICYLLFLDMEQINAIKAKLRRRKTVTDNA
ncbi:MAG: HTTM domain-containing protein [Crocinitomicaceae bacterium]|nr:HTTM domain-containing protein [Crocinitomicaceae bacterium]